MELLSDKNKAYFYIPSAQVPYIQMFIVLEKLQLKQQWRKLGPIALLRLLQPPTNVLGPTVLDSRLLLVYSPEPRCKKI